MLDFNWTLRDALSVLAALGPFVTFLVFWLTRRKERKRDMKELHSLWSFEIVDEKKGDQVRMGLLRLDDPHSNRVRITGISVLSPRGCKIAKVKTNTNGSPARSPDGEFSRSLNESRNATASVYYGPGQPMVSGFSEIRYFLSVPTRPWSFCKDLTSISIRVSVEERSARRERRNFVIRSQPIPWTTKSANIRH